VRGVHGGCAKERSPEEKTMKIGLVRAALAAAFVLALAPSASAQTTPPPPAAEYVERNVDGNQVVTFPGDTLPGDQNSAYGFTLRRPPGVLRAGLIRPRVNFVSELLKSVENL